MENKRVWLPISLLDENIGQIPDVPENPREITKEKYALLKQNIDNYPELMNYNLIKVYPLEGRYVVIDGNMRLKALREKGVEQALCYIIEKDSTPSKLEAYVFPSNASFGKWDWSKLLNGDWDKGDLPQWGLTLPQYEDTDLDGLFDVGQSDNTERIVVNIPESLSDMKKAIREDIENLLSDYSGIKIK